MEKIYEVIYAEYVRLLTKKEHELSIILQAHGIMPSAAHEVMALNETLQKFYNDEVIELNSIIDKLAEKQQYSTNLLLNLRNNNDSDKIH